MVNMCNSIYVIFGNLSFKSHFSLSELTEYGTEYIKSVHILFIVSNVDLWKLTASVKFVNGWRWFIVDQTEPTELWIRIF